MQVTYKKTTDSLRIIYTKIINIRSQFLKLFEKSNKYLWFLKHSVYYRGHRDKRDIDGNIQQPIGGHLPTAPTWNYDVVYDLPTTQTDRQQISINSYNHRVTKLLMKEEIQQRNLIVTKNSTRDCVKTCYVFQLIPVSIGLAKLHAKSQ